MKEAGNVTFVGDYAVITTQIEIDVEHESEKPGHECLVKCDCCLGICDCANELAESEAAAQLKSYHGIDVYACGLGVDTVEITKET